MPRNPRKEPQQPSEPLDQQATASQVQRDSEAVVTRQFFEGRDPSSDPDTKNEVVQVYRFVTEPAKVSVSKGLTLNLGNYESARIDVSIVVPCYREELDSAYKYADAWVENRLNAEVQSVRKNKPGLF